MVDVVKQDAIDAACDGVLGGHYLHLHGTVGAAMASRSGIIRVTNLNSTNGLYVDKFPDILANDQ